MQTGKTQKTKKTSNDAKSRFICRKRGAGMFLKSAESGNPSRLKSNWVRGSPLGVWRPPDEAARDLRLHGDLRRRLSPVRSAALQAVSQSHDRLLTPQPSPSVLHSFLRRRLVGRLESQHAPRFSHCQYPAGSTAPLRSSGTGHRAAAHVSVGFEKVHSVFQHRKGCLWWASLLPRALTNICA